MNCHLSATLKRLRQSILLIGYGSPLRSDDAVGQRIAETIATWGMPNVESIAVHQLTPELIEKLAHTDVAIFVDAYPASSWQAVQVRPLPSASAGVSLGHWCEPQTLLSMTQALYGCQPSSWQVMVPGANFQLGDELSAIAAQGMEVALQDIERLIQSPALCQSKEHPPCSSL
jgi:hydrogenase maturation protease